MTRRLTYQPLGHYWAFPLAERLAATLQPTWIRPNSVTLAAAAFMLSAAGLVAFGGTNLPWRITAALALAVALVLDTADGRLARLQGTCSEFGRWLDQVLDELADIALHVAISWSLFQSSREPWWLLLGMLYVSGKYLFQVQSLAGEELEGDSRPAPIRALTRNKGWRSWPRKLVAAVGHADVRWHLWMMLALMGRLDLALMIYTAYFFVRAVGGSLRKVVSHG